jgi:GDP-4-dehydro-6-deoxy-D-mannose reductase
MFAVRVRIFNVTGPGKTGDVSSDFARRIVNIEKGDTPPVLKVGNLQSRRDVTDVRDGVSGLYLALERGEAGEVYNLCSGKAHQISELLSTMLSLTEKSVKTEVDPNLLRPSDEPIIIGSNEKLYKQTGWEVTIPIHKTVEDILNYWRQH